MTKFIGSLLFDEPRHPMLHWELEGVMVLMLVVLGVVHLLVPESPRRRKIVYWSVLGYYAYLLVLVLLLGALALCES